MMIVRVCLTGLVLLLFSSSGFAAPAGRTVGISPVARIISGSAEGNLSVGQDVFMGDTIATGATGEVQIRFEDQTRLVIGPGSQLLISQYVTSGGKADAFAINAAKGAFRFISGISPKPNYQITTQTGTIGVRGTRFDFGVRARGRTYVLMYDGIARLCGSAGSCRDIDELCEIAGTNSRGDARLAQESDFLPRRGDLRRSFPYVRSQGSLNDDFRIAQARRCLDAVGTASGPDAGGADAGGADGAEGSDGNSGGNSD